MLELNISYSPEHLLNFGIKFQFALIPFAIDKHRENTFNIF
jgi:hypothetical protein